MANYEQGNFYSMADRVDCRPKNKIFKPAMPVRRHNDEIRLHVVSGGGDLLGGIVSMPYNHINLDVLIAQGRNDVRKVILPLGDFRSRCKRTEHLAGYSFFNMQENDA